jgi:hypothetical protein
MLQVDSRSREEITEDVARLFGQIVQAMQNQGTYDSNRSPYFLAKLAFCLFAEDVGLLPQGLGEKGGVFSEIVRESGSDPLKLASYLGQLFQAMNTGGSVLLRDIPYFNGALFQDSQTQALPPTALYPLEQACRENWASVSPTIFGTLFERWLDPAKRSELGAHYTSQRDIEVLVKPMIISPLRRHWLSLQEAIKTARQKYESAENRQAQLKAENHLLTLRAQILDRVRQITVLDPACGSGNFLYVSLRYLLDFEKEVLSSPLWAGLPGERPGVHPRQLFGMEKDPIAHALASIVVWIGYIQWLLEHGYRYLQEPILEDLSGNILWMDAILTPEGGEPAWPRVDVVLGNPPFLGEKLQRRELGEAYVDQLRALYEDRLSGNADLVLYWFERARREIEQGRLKRAGLLATNSIRQPTNRAVLERIKSTGDIFLAWSDRPWQLPGAAVRISMVGFDDGSETVKTLDGAPVESINADLRNSIDATQARRLAENANLSFMGVTPGGPFDVEEAQARAWIDADPQNAEVVKPYINGADLVQGSRGHWTVDFGTEMDETQARRYAGPFAYVESVTKPLRLASRQPEREKDRWWLYTRPRPEMRAAIGNLPRYLVTPQTSKHRVFVWLPAGVMPSNTLLAFGRADDYFFGVLQSRVHEAWALRIGTTLGETPRYIPTYTFETFPLPWPPGQEETQDPRYQALAAAGRALHEAREAWLHPPDAPVKTLAKRNLTELYNALWIYWGREKGKASTEAGHIAPSLSELHRHLDEALCAAYGWEPSLWEDEEALLRALLVLNVERAGY